MDGQKKPPVCVHGWLMLFEDDATEPFAILQDVADVRALLIIRRGANPEFGASVAPQIRLEVATHYNRDLCPKCSKAGEPHGRELSEVLPNASAEGDT